MNPHLTTLDDLDNPRWTLDEAIACREIARRRRAVRKAKLAKLGRGLEPELTNAELDGVLPAVECARTRCRREGIAYRNCVRASGQKRKPGGQPLKLDADSARAIREARAQGVPPAILAARYGVSAMMISLVVTGKRWSQACA